MHSQSILQPPANNWHYRIESSKRPQVSRTILMFSNTEGISLDELKRLRAKDLKVKNINGEPLALTVCR